MAYQLLGGLEGDSSTARSDSKSATTPALSVADVRAASTTGMIPRCGAVLIHSTATSCMVPNAARMHC